ncbi:hypothetical protein [Latilactobacillus sakei]|uniref:hypothetical protein n=1 Tax=Latilactobacillus sakei TaxID=1599 RepID=UPI00019CF8B1|nr:hypothetical protein [Latilactobacillus sakei]MCP8851776.1 hypothetical protein [Latilactobacillus sakei]MCP8855217.1 hypothetical protein [Latilactobacillus sakei]GEP21132.1 hypothetical protein LSA03nite_07200 [Latilactobacillus sakei subsp. carnosus]
MKIDNNRVFCINDYKYSLFRETDGRWFIYLRGRSWFAGADSSLKNDQLKRVKNHGLTYLGESETSWYELPEDDFEREIRPFIKSRGQMSLFD